MYPALVDAIDECYEVFARSGREAKEGVAAQGDVRQVAAEDVQGDILTDQFEQTVGRLPVARIQGR